MKQLPDCSEINPLTLVNDSHSTAIIEKQAERSLFQKFRALPEVPACKEIKHMHNMSRH